MPWPYTGLKDATASPAATSRAGKRSQLVEVAAAAVRLVVGDHVADASRRWWRRRRTPREVLAAAPAVVVGVAAGPVVGVPGDEHRPAVALDRREPADPRGAARVRRGVDRDRHPHSRVRRAPEQRGGVVELDAHALHRRPRRSRTPASQSPSRLDRPLASTTKSAGSSTTSSEPAGTYRTPVTAPSVNIRPSARPRTAARWPGPSTRWRISASRNGRLEISACAAGPGRRVVAQLAVQVEPVGRPAAG